MNNRIDFAPQSRPAWHGYLIALAALGLATLITISQVRIIHEHAIAAYLAGIFVLFCAGAARVGAVRRRARSDRERARAELERQVAASTADLHRARRYLTQALELTQMGVWASPLDERTGSFWSDGVYRVFGYAEDVMPNIDRILERVHPRDRGRVLRMRTDAIRENRPFELHYRILWPDGRVRYVHSVGWPFTSEDGSTAEYLGAIVDVTRARRIERALRRARERKLHAEFVARLEERNRLAREMHDTLIQGFTGVSLRLLAATNRMRAPKEDVDELRDVIATAQRTLKEARSAVWQIRQPAGGQLSSTIQAAVQELTRAAGIKLEFVLNGYERGLPPDVETTMLLVAREAVLNAVKHANASNIRVHIGFRHRVAHLCVEDDGSGFTPEPDDHAYGGHYGLLGMRERASEVGGRLRIQSAPGAGTRLVLNVPLPDHLRQKPVGDVADRPSDIEEKDTCAAG